jgi:hypothetical protein
MPMDKRLYPPDWDVQRKVRIQQAGGRCQVCGVAQFSWRQSPRTGQPYLVYLSLAHRNQYETWKEDADTMVLCQACHRRYDRRFRRKAGRRYASPVGYAALYVQDGRSPVHACAGHARSYDDLRDMVATLPDETLFEVQLIVNQAVVGNGSYHKAGDGVAILREYGACQGLPL